MKMLKEQLKNCMELRLMVKRSRSKRPVPVMKVLQGVVAEDSEEDHEALGEAVEEAVEEEDVEVEIEVEDAADLVAAIEPATIATRRVILQENAQNRTNVTDKPRCCTITEKKFPFLIL
jgi:hypothetical protein